jgi:hypothetical protein
VSGGGGHRAAYAESGAREVGSASGELGYCD